MIAISEMPSIGIKALKVHSVSHDGIVQLKSPFAGSIWTPASQYRAKRGIFFWALPQELLEVALPHPDSVLAIVSVLPQDAEGVELVPARSLQWPATVADVLPCDRDAMAYRNFLALAHCLQVQQFIVPGSWSDYMTHALGRSYQLPVIPRVRSEPYCRVDVHHVCVVGGMSSVMLDHEHWCYHDERTVYTRDWRNADAREEVFTVIDKVLRGELIERRRRD